MRQIKPDEHFKKLEIEDPFLAQRLQLAAESIRRGDKTYTIEEVFEDIRKLIKEKCSNGTLSHNNKHSSQKRSY